MSETRYLSAIHTEVQSLPLGRLSIRTRDDHELGKLLGFVIDPQSRHISGLVLEVIGAAGSQQMTSPLVPMRFDADARALRFVEAGTPRLTEFLPESVSPVEEEDLWVPLVHTAA